MTINLFFAYMLQNKNEVIDQALKGELPKLVVQSMVAASTICFAAFGLMLGSSHSLVQGMVSFLKLPILFFSSAMLCFPTLYIFLALFGTGIGLKGLSQFGILTLAIMALIVIAFTPISLFFLVVGTPYQTYKLINVGILAIAGFSGVYLFYKSITLKSSTTGSKTNASRVHIFTMLWLFMFGLIGANLGFAISPIFGDPNSPFMLLTPADENFYTHLLNSLSY